MEIEDYWKKKIYKFYGFIIVILIINYIVYTNFSSISLKIYNYIYYAYIFCMLVNKFYFFKENFDFLKTAPKFLVAPYSYSLD